MATQVFFFGGFLASHTDMKVWAGDAASQRSSVDFQPFAWPSGAKSDAHGAVAGAHNSGSFRKENDAEECSRGRGVAAGEGVVFWTLTRAIPAQLVFDRRPRASGGNLDPARYDSGQGAGQDHR